MAGLFVARVALEASGLAWPGVLVVAVGVLAALGGLALGQWLARRNARLWPMLVLPVYVLWPRRDLGVAASIVVLALLVWLLSGERRRWPRWVEPVVDGATFAVALAVYAATAAPDVLPADAGEFQLVVARLGVAHPFGFPLYTMVGHLFVRLLPWGTPAYRLNLLSGVLAAGTLVFMARATRLWAGRLGASPLVAVGSGLAAALTLGTSTTFWAQATIANIRTPALFFAALALYALARFATAEDAIRIPQSRVPPSRKLPAFGKVRQSAIRIPQSAFRKDRALILLGLALGLGGGHYPPLAFVVLFFLAYLLLIDPRLALQPRRWWRPLLVGAASFLVPLVYLPIQGARGAPLAPPGLDTLPGFLHHFLAQGFAGDMFAFATGPMFPHRLALVRTLFPFQFNAGLLAAAFVGLVVTLRRDWRLFVLLAGSLVLHTFVTVTYRAPQTVEYLMPAYLPLAIVVGLLPAHFADRTSVHQQISNLQPPTSNLQPPTSNFQLPTLFCSLVLWSALLNGCAHGPSFVTLAQEASTRQMVEPLLKTAPSQAVVLADWHWATPLWYLQQVEGLRPDVEVRYVWPVAGEEYRETWLRRMRESDPGRPLMLTHFYDFPGYTAEPWEAGFLVRPRPVAEPAAPLVPVSATFGEKVRLVGYRLRPGQFEPGQVAEFVLAWQPAPSPSLGRGAGGEGQPPSFTLRLVDGEGQTLAQADRALGTGVAAGEVRFERLMLPLYPTLPPGRYRVVLGAYVVSEAGFETLPADGGQAAVTLTELELLGERNQVFPKNLVSPGPFTLHRQSVPFLAGSPPSSFLLPHFSFLLPPSSFLVGVDYDRSVPDVLWVVLHWRGPVEPGWQVQVRTADGLRAAAPLSPIPEGTYQTVAVDLPGAVKGALRLALTNAEGQVQRAAGVWGWAGDEVQLPAPAPDARFVLLGDEMAVIGATAKTVAGETVVVDVTLVALRPLMTDDATSVRLVDGQGRWLATHDTQPALGAVPTLKWIRGSHIVDRHLLPLPQDFAGGEVRATFVAYERFRMTPLPALDGRFSSEVPLGSWGLP
jgi:4-amino-4-deoxy-L-arabinose transferase-like glycosyltransferase